MSAARRLGQYCSPPLTILKPSNGSRLLANPPPEYSPTAGLRRVMWVDLGYGEASAEQRMSCDGDCGAGQQAPEGMGAVPGQLHQVGDLAERGLDPVAPLGDDLEQDGRHGGALVLGGRDEHGGAAGGLGGGERLAVEALVRQQVTGPGPGAEQVIGDV